VPDTQDQTSGVDRSLFELEQGVEDRSELLRGPLPKRCRFVGEATCRVIGVCQTLTDEAENSYPLGGFKQVAGAFAP
jgi:hypothetical protein